MESSNGDDNTDENPYLALREAKIRRNEARLRELGLLKSVKPQIPRRKPVSSKPKEPAVPMRRSKRLSDQQPGTIDNVIAAVPSPIDQPPVHKRARVVTPPSRTSLQDVPTGKDTQMFKPPSAPKAIAANSVRSISLCTKRLVLGNAEKDTETSSQGGLLGVSMMQTGKDFVVYKSFEVAASSVDQQRLEGARLSFNKYSGVQEWEDCIFLWVNLGDKNNSVFNEFLNEGDQITWYGGSRMVDESIPVVSKLLEWGKQATDISSRIVLWCRRFDVERKAFGPYVCLGRLAYQSHEPGSYPLAFVWKLLDYERLRKHEDDQMREGFRALIDATR